MLSVSAPTTRLSEFPLSMPVAFRHIQACSNSMVELHVSESKVNATILSVNAGLHPRVFFCPEKPLLVHEAPCCFVIGIGGLSLKFIGTIKRTTVEFFTFTPSSVSTLERRQGTRRAVFSEKKPLPLFVYTDKNIYAGRAADLSTGGIRLQELKEGPAFPPSKLSVAFSLPDEQPPLKIQCRHLGNANGQWRLQFLSTSVSEFERLERFTSAYLPF